MREAFVGGRSARTAVVIATLLLVASRARAADRLFLATDPGEPIGHGAVHTFTDADGTFASSGSAHAITVTFSGAETTWYLQFEAGQGILVQGSYTVPIFGTSTSPRMRVWRVGEGCNANGQFTIREISFDGLGNLERLAVDFEQRCDFLSKQLVGSLRLRAGDGACDVAPDGTPCDDLDACTAGDACHAGTCVGTDGVSPGCTTSGACLAAGSCNPATGSCVAGAAADGTDCDDGDPHTTNDVCLLGLCAPCAAAGPCRNGFYLPYQDRCDSYPKSYGEACDDGRPDTVDRCNGDGVCVGCPAPRPCERVFPNYTGSACGALIEPYGACDDGDACTTGDTCTSEGCRGTPVDCDDGNPCTTDGCDRTRGCTHDLVPGCWLVATRTVVTARASGEVAGHSVECRSLRCQQAGLSALLLPGDGSYRTPAIGAQCERDPSFTVPDEVGTARRRKGRIYLRLSNRAAIRRALRHCTGRRVSLGAASEWVKIAPDGRSLTGVSHTELTVFAQLPIQQTIVSRLDGRLGTFPPAPALKRGMPQCSPDLQLSCKVD